jgi:hypothetical protein
MPEPIDHFVPPRDRIGGSPDAFEKHSKIDISGEESGVETDCVLLSGNCFLYFIQIRERDTQVEMYRIEKWIVWIVLDPFSVKRRG